MKSVNIASVIIAENIKNVLSAIVAEIMQILQNQIKQNVRTDSANEIGSTLFAAKIVNNFNPQN